MEITRKSFISGTAIGLAGLTLIPELARAAGLAEPDGEAVGLNRAVGERFYARGSGGGVVPLDLVRADDLPASDLLEQYSLYFATDEGTTLAEGTWRLVSSSGSRRYDVFLTPAGTDARGVALYRADFCLLKRPVALAPRP